MLCLVFSTGNLLFPFFQTLIEKEPPLVLPSQHHLLTASNSNHWGTTLQFPSNTHLPKFVCLFVFKPSADRCGQLYTNTRREMFQLGVLLKLECASC